MTRDEMSIDRHADTAAEAKREIWYELAFYDSYQSLASAVHLHNEVDACDPSAGGGDASGDVLTNLLDLINARPYLNQVANNG